MELRDLIEALMDFDALSARQWVADAKRAGLTWSEVKCPVGLSPEELAVAAGVVELLAERAGQKAPEWTAGITSSPRRVFLVRSAETMPGLRRLCEQQAPEPLRKRRVLAPPEFLTMA
jgi:hypothetical protein